jgi:hypothetical protein
MKQKEDKFPNLEKARQRKAYLRGYEAGFDRACVMVEAYMETLLAKKIKDKKGVSEI